MRGIQIAFNSQGKKADLAASDSGSTPFRLNATCMISRDFAANPILES